MNNDSVMRDLIDGRNRRNQRERAKTQLTLGKFIKILETLPSDMEIDGLHMPHSYRGYYIDLAFEKMDRKQTVEEILFMCRKCLGEIFEGYKGGDSGMTKNTPIWRAFYGRGGERILNIDVNTGELTLSEDDT